MLQAIDPFEQYKAKKEIERLEKKMKSSASVKCPSEKDAKDGSGKVKLDASRAWIY